MGKWRCIIKREDRVDQTNSGLLLTSGNSHLATMIAGDFPAVNRAKLTLFPLPLLFCYLC